MPNLVNDMVLRELNDELKDAEGMVVVSFGGLDVKLTEELRGDIAGRGAKVRMVRNRLVRRVLADRGVEFDGEVLKGNTAIAYGDAEAAIGAAKVLSDPKLKKAGLVQFKAGVLQGDVLDSSSAAALAEIPDRDTLRAMMLGVINGPARSLATVISAVPSSVARVLQARVDAGDESA